MVENQDVIVDQPTILIFNSLKRVEPVGTSARLVVEPFGPANFKVTGLKGTPNPAQKFALQDLGIHVPESYEL